MMCAGNTADGIRGFQHYGPDVGLFKQFPRSGQTGRAGAYDYGFLHCCDCLLKRMNLRAKKFQKNTMAVEMIFDSI